MVCLFTDNRKSPSNIQGRCENATIFNQVHPPNSCFLHKRINFRKMRMTCIPAQCWLSRKLIDSWIKAPSFICRGSRQVLLLTIYFLGSYWSVYISQCARKMMIFLSFLLFAIWLFLNADVQWQIKPKIETAVCVTRRNFLLIRSYIIILCGWHDVSLTIKLFNMGTNWSQRLHLLVWCSFMATFQNQARKNLRSEIICIESSLWYSIVIKQLFLK